jgi:flagellar motility protein MotE (MotC chaperone)
MEEGNLILLIVAGIGFIQVTFAAILAYLNNKSTARKDNESVYAGLVDRLENRLAEEREREAKYEERIAALEEKCERYEHLLKQYEGINTVENE